MTFRLVFLQFLNGILIFLPELGRRDPCDLPEVPGEISIAVETHLFRNDRERQICIEQHFLRVADPHIQNILPERTAGMLDKQAV